MDFATDNFTLCVKIMKTLKFQDDIPSIAIDSFGVHYVMVFDLTLMQEATEFCLFPKPFGEPMRLKLNFTFPLEHVTELIVLRRECLLLQLTSLVLLEKNLNCIIFLSSKTSFVSHKQSISTVVLFSLTMFQLLTMTFLLL